MSTEYESAPRGMTSILKELRGSCQEIAERWPSILKQETERESKRATVVLI
jgi:hypothetical protein